MTPLLTRQGQEASQLGAYEEVGEVPHYLTALSDEHIVLS